jgi:hypothetical protein
MYAQLRAYKIVGSIALVLVSFWATLQLLESYERRDPWATYTARMPVKIPRPDGPLADRIDIDLFDRDSGKVQDLSISYKAARASDGTQSAILLEDKSASTYGTIYQDVAIADDDRVHTVTVDIKAGSSPLAQIAMHYLNGERRTYYAYIDTRTMKTTGEGQIWSSEIGNGWHRVAISGPNNKSGNRTLRVQVYPRHGKPEDAGSIYIANARLDP